MKTIKNSIVRRISAQISSVQKKKIQMERVNEEYLIEIRNKTFICFYKKHSTKQREPSHKTTCSSQSHSHPEEFGQLRNLRGSPPRVPPIRLS